MSSTRVEQLGEKLVTSEVNADFTEAVLQLQDGSRLCFCHRVDERWAKAVGPEGQEARAELAEEFLSAITLFRLNSRHLDIQFADGSRWDEPHADSPADSDESRA